MDKTLAVFVCLLLYTTFQIVSLFGNKRGVYALIPLEFIENFLMILHCSKNDIIKVYFFDASEKDADFGALLLQGKKITVCKIPSEGSLLFHYKFLVTDVLCCTSPYQMDELNRVKSKLKDKFFVKKILLSPPNCIYNGNVKYADSNSKQPRKIIGYISGGVWRRKERRDFNSGDGHYESEENLLLYLKDFIQCNSDFQLCIYMHPCEKESEELFLKGKKIYHEFFASQNLIFTDRFQSTREAFHISDIAVSVYSNANFERLYCGFKTIFAPFSISDFPYPSSPLTSICAKSKEDLFDLLLKNCSYSMEEFFKQNRLEHYLYKNYSASREVSF